MFVVFCYHTKFSDSELFCGQHVLLFPYLFSIKLISALQKEFATSKDNVKCLFFLSVASLVC